MSNNVNAGLVTQLEELLAAARAGAIDKAALIAIGPDRFEHRFAVPEAKDMPTMIGEVELFILSMKNQALNARIMAQQAHQRPSIMRPNRMQS